jgi:AsmA family protein
MKGASISSLLVELIGLDIGSALILYITEDNRIPIRCAAGRILFSKGEATFAPFIMDTKDSVLHFRGLANMKQQTMRIQVEADAKDFSLLDIDAPVAAEGKIRDPEISIGPGVPIPIIEPGDAENIPCAQLVNTILTDR